MGNYILKRFLLIPPGLILISLLSFMISNMSPVDPILEQYDDPSSQAPLKMQLAQINLKRKKFHLDLPAFYFSVHPIAEPDTLYRIFPLSERQAARDLIFTFGNWPGIQTFRKEVQKWYQAIYSEQIKSVDFQKRLLLMNQRRNAIALLSTQDTTTIRLLIEQGLENDPGNPFLKEVHVSYLKLTKFPERWRNFIPGFSWYGTKNQYHIWLKGVVTSFDFGLSRKTETSVSEQWAYFSGITLRFTILAVLFSYLIAIPLGVWMVMRIGRWQDKWAGICLFALDSIPAFWLGTVLLILFADPDYLGWLPFAYDSSGSVSEQISGMILPIVTYVSALIAGLNRIFRASLLKVMEQDFILTARAKGLSEKRVVWKHALRNSLIPMITLLAMLIPFLISGSVVVERIFSIPGLGEQIVTASLTRDVQMVVMIFSLAGMFTLLGYLLGDILIALADPRIRFDQKSSS